jgi:hypothetical protein
LQTNPPPLPEPSRKRILPAFLLCFLLCLHRFYAGKYITGFIQFAWVTGAYFWTKTAWKEPLEIFQTAQLNLETIGRISEWEQSHAASFLPILIFIAAGIWVAVDASLLISRKFTDRDGKKITRWM